MLRYLKLENFKNFRDATLHMGPFTVLVGANASGKSNLRDAFRVLHGISRGYSAAETLGEKWIEGGVLQWPGFAEAPAKRLSTERRALCSVWGSISKRKVPSRKPAIALRFTWDLLELPPRSTRRS